MMWKKATACAALAAGLMFGSGANAGDLILNEYNAVGSGKHLEEDNFGDSTKADSTFGRIDGNGGNWFELVVTTDLLDIRGWELRWAETGSSETDGTDVWYGDSTVDQGILKFSNDAVLSNLRSGTIITIGEEQTINDESSNQVINGSDTSYDPANGDWWIHLYSFDSTYFDHSVDTTNVNGDDKNGAFSVGNDDWELTILDDQGVTNFGPAGEDIADQGVNSNEVFKLEADPVFGISVDDTSDYNDGTSSTFGAPNIWSGGDNTQDFSTLRSAVPEPGSLALLAMGGLTLLRRRH